MKTTALACATVVAIGCYYVLVIHNFAGLLFIILGALAFLIITAGKKRKPEEGKVIIIGSMENDKEGRPIVLYLNDRHLWTEENSAAKQFSRKEGKEILDIIGSAVNNASLFPAND